MRKIILVVCLSIGVMMFGAVGLMSQANALIITSLPSDFSVTQGANNIYYEAYPDNRPTNTTNPNSGSPYLLAYAGIGVMGHNGPTYTAPEWFPFIVFDTDSSTLLLHPGTGGYIFGSGSSNIGASIQFSAPQSGYYNISGDFARANVNQYAGNGVDVLIFRGTDPGNALFAASIDATHPVDTNDYFGGTGVSHFDFGVNLAQNDVLRFAVFCDAQGQDGTFDVTALRVTIVPIPSTVFLLGFGIAGLAGLKLTRIGRTKTQL